MGGETVRGLGKGIRLGPRRVCPGGAESSFSVSFSGFAILFLPWASKKASPPFSTGSSHFLVVRRKRHRFRSFGTNISRYRGANHAQETDFQQFPQQFVKQSGQS